MYVCLLARASINNRTEASAAYCFTLQERAEIRKRDAITSLEREKAVFTGTADQGSSPRDPDVQRRLQSAGVRAGCLSFSVDDKLHVVCAGSGSFCFDLSNDVLAADLAMQDAFLDISLREPSATSSFGWDHNILPNKTC
jgi:hypothetical protein